MGCTRPQNRFHHVIVTHGVTARTMIMANFHFTQECALADLCIVRHGQSEANVDKMKYIEDTDSKVALTEEGKKQARIAAGKLKKTFEETDQKLVFWVSPYTRTRETAREMLEILGEKVVAVKE